MFGSPAKRQAAAKRKYGALSLSEVETKSPPAKKYKASEAGHQPEGGSLDDGKVVCPVENCVFSDIRAFADEAACLYHLEHAAHTQCVWCTAPTATAAAYFEHIKCCMHRWKLCSAQCTGGEDDSSLGRIDQRFPGLHRCAASRLAASAEALKASCDAILCSLAIGRLDVQRAALATERHLQSCSADLEKAADYVDAAVRQIDMINETLVKSGVPLQRRESVPSIVAAAAASGKEEKKKKAVVSPAAADSEMRFAQPQWDDEEDGAVPPGVVLRSTASLMAELSQPKTPPYPPAAAVDEEDEEPRVGQQLSDILFGGL